MEYREEGLYSNEIELLEHTLETYNQVINERDKYALQNQLGVSYFLLGNVDKAREFYVQSLEGNIKLFGETDLQVAANKANLSLVYK